jgi:hypothetical protein
MSGISASPLERDWFAAPPPANLLQQKMRVLKALKYASP